MDRRVDSCFGNQVALLISGLFEAKSEFLSDSLRLTDLLSPLKKADVGD
jgi:hypothetical protein